MAGYRKGSEGYRIERRARIKYGRRARRWGAVALICGIILGIVLCYFTNLIPAINAFQVNGFAAGVKKLFNQDEEIRIVAAPTPVPDLTEAPLLTQAPVVTEAPAITQAPVITEAPAITQAPDLTEAPVLTPAPVITEAPAITQAPIVTEAPVLTPAPVVTEAPVVTPPPAEPQTPAQPVGMESAVAPGEWFSFETQIGSDGQAYAADGGTPITIPMGVRITGLITPEEYKAKYEGIYMLHGTESAIVLEIRNDSGTEISPQNALRFALIDESGDIYDSYPLMDAALGGRTSIRIAPGETAAVYKRFTHVEGKSNPYLAVTYTLNGAQYKTYFDLRPLDGE